MEIGKYLEVATSCQIITFIFIFFWITLINKLQNTVILLVF